MDDFSPTPALYKRKDYIAVDEKARFHPNRTYYFKNADVDDVILTCSKKLSINREDVRALYVRGSSYFKKRCYDEAIIDLGAVIAKDVNHVEAYYYRGIAYSKLNQQERAIDDLSIVLNLNADHVNALFARAACYNAIGQFSKAIEDYNYALLKDEDKGPSMSTDGKLAGVRRSRERLSPFSGSNSGKSTNSGSISPTARDVDYSSTGFQNVKQRSGSSSSLEGSSNERGIMESIPVAVEASLRLSQDSDSIANSAASSPTKSAAARGDEDRGSKDRHEDMIWETPQAESSINRQNFEALLSEAQSLYNETHPTSTDGGHSGENGDKSDSEEEDDDDDDVLSSLKVTVVPVRSNANYTQGQTTPMKPKEGVFGFSDTDVGGRAGRVGEGAYPSTPTNRGTNAHAANTTGMKSTGRRAPPPIPGTDSGDDTLVARMGLTTEKKSSANDRQERSVSPSSEAQAEAFHSRGYQLRKQGDFSGAITEYSKALQYNPAHFKALFNRGFAKDKLQLYSEAVEDYGQALQLEPENAFAYYNRGISYDRNGSFESAYNDFTQAIRILPNNADFYHNRAFCLRKMNKIDAAVLDYSESLKLHPKHFKALHNRAFCLEKLGDLAGSVSDYTKALEIEPTNISTLTARALVYEKQLDYDKAVADLTYAVHLIESLEDARKAKEGGDSVEIGSAVRESEMKPTLYVSLGSIHSKLNKLDTAQSYFTQALSAHGFLQAGTPSSSPSHTRHNLPASSTTTASSTTASTIFYARAMNYKVQGAYQAAIADFSR